MQLEFHQLDRRWEHLRARRPHRQRRLMASLAESGQQTPIVVVLSPDHHDRYLVIDGHKRIAALQQLGRDTVEAVVWPLGEAEALLLDRSLRFSEHETALEQGWLLAEMEQRFGYGLDELARRFDRSVSWVSRRLSLVELLPEAIQQQVREGKISAHVAMKYLVPAARINLEDCLRMAAAFDPASLRHQASRATVCGLARRLTGDPATPARRARIVFQNAAASGTESYGSAGRRTPARSGDGGSDCEPRHAAAGGRGVPSGPRGDGWSATRSRAAPDRAHGNPTSPSGRENSTGARAAC